MYIYIHIYIYTYIIIYMQICAWIYIYIHTYVYIDLHIYETSIRDARLRFAWASAVPRVAYLGFIWIDVPLLFKSTEVPLLLWDVQLSTLVSVGSVWSELVCVLYNHAVHWYQPKRFPTRRLPMYRFRTTLPGLRASTWWNLPRFHMNQFAFDWS